jgi:hypothetical protein
MHTSTSLIRANGLRERVSPVPFLARSHLFFSIITLALPLTARAQFNNTAYGDSALSKNGGHDNSAFGGAALFYDTTGFNNTAVGSHALQLNNGDSNTGTGVFALYDNQTGDSNTAIGAEALRNNDSGSFNTATGALALFSNHDGGVNVANGYKALEANVSGFYNVALGGFALGTNTGGSYNVATGANTLYYNKGSSNTASGHQALQNNTTGGNNVAVGYRAGNNLTTGSNNIVIGAGVLGAAGDANKIRIGKSTHTATFIGGISGKTVANGVGVIINSSGQLGTIQSSARYKDAIKPMDKASEAILALKPVTFRYKEELDPEKIPQFGLIAEEVEKVRPDLVVRDDEGKAMTVRYEAVNAMLLNEFLKEHRKVQELETTVAEQQERFQATIVKQQRQIEALTAGLQR